MAETVQESSGCPVRRAQLRNVVRFLEQRGRLALMNLRTRWFAPVPDYACLKHYRQFTCGAKRTSRSASCAPRWSTSCSAFISAATITKVKTVPARQRCSPIQSVPFRTGSSGRQGEVLRELARFDPALEAHPQIDRSLLHPPSAAADSSLPRYNGLSLEEARRRAYFEWPKEEAQRLTGDPNALELAQGRHLREFRELATNDDPYKRGRLTKDLCAGISRLETLPSEALARPDVVQLKITPRTPTETAFWVEKPVRNFRLEADMSGAEELDRLHRQAFLIYRYRAGREERLRLGAELFHLLLELSDGYQLGDVATDDTFAHLSIFVQRLVQEDHRQVFAWNPMREDTIFRVSARMDHAGADPRQRMVIEPFEQPGKWHAE